MLPSSAIARPIPFTSERMSCSPWLRSRSLSDLDQLGARQLLRRDRLAREGAPVEQAARGALGKTLRLDKSRDRLGMQPAARQHPDAVAGLADSLLEQLEAPRALEEVQRRALRQQLEALADILEGIDHPQEGRDGHHLRRVESNAHAVRVGARQETAGGRVVEVLAIVERDGALDRLDGVVVEERPGLGGLDERGRVERAVPRCAEAVVPGDPLAGESSGLVGQILHPGIEIGVAGIAAAERGVGSGVAVADVALPQPVVEEDLLTTLRDGSLERQRKLQIALAPERELEGLERVELRLCGEPEVDPGDAVERSREMLDHGAGRKRAQ